MVDKVVQLKTPELDRDPHVTLATLDGNVHVVPVIVLEKFVAGEPGEYPDNLALRSIVNDWLRMLGAPTCAQQPDPEERGPAPDNVVTLKR
jgi:hypothetical protein